jgi:hypothetical protein
MAEKLQVDSIARGRPDRPIQQEYSSTDVGELVLPRRSRKFYNSCSEKSRA